MFKQTHLEGKLMWSWFLSVFLFYSLIIKSKLHWYIIPCFIPLIFISIELIKYCVDTNLLFQNKKKNKILLITSMSCCLVYPLCLVGISIFYKEIGKSDISEIKPIITSATMSKFKGKEIYYYKNEWQQNEVFYIEIAGFIAKNEGHFGHKNSLNSLYCIETKQKERYILDNPDENLVFTNSAYSIFLN